MAKLAKLASGLNCRDARNQKSFVPRYFVMSDPVRLPDPLSVLGRVPRGAALVLRHNDRDALSALTKRVLPVAKARGIKVLVSGDMRLALSLGADGLHLSERQARRGPPRTMPIKPGFLITAAAHSRPALWRAAQAGAHAVFLSPVFSTKSHPDAQPLGVLRFSRMARTSPLAVIALGGIEDKSAKRLKLGPASAIAAIEAWQTS
ncbi:thiamine phosphate synthase [Pseudomonadota bacterium]